MQTWTHDGIVDIVEQELLNRGFYNIHKLVEYKRNYVEGEIDIYATKGNYVLLFEIKTNKCMKNHSKGISQLYKAEHNYFNKNQRVFKFFTYHQQNEVVYEWVTRK